MLCCCRCCCSVVECNLVFNLIAQFQIEFQFPLLNLRKQYENCFYLFFSFSLILFSWLHFAFTYTFLYYRNGYMFVSVCEYICCIVEYLFVGSLIALVLVCCCCLYEFEMKVKFLCKVLYFYSIVSE